MAYGLKYTSTAYGISSTLWKVELLEKDYVPEEGELPINLKMVGNGIAIGNDREDWRFNVIYSRYAVINFKSTSLFNIDTLQFDDEKKYQVRIYQNDVLDFVGWLIPFYSSEEYEDVSISQISVQAKDGINQLKNIKFIDEHPEIASNKQSFKDIICQCLRNVGYGLNTEIYYNKYDSLMGKTSTDCPLAQLYFNIASLEKNDNEYLDYYEVLFRLLSSHDLQIKQIGGVWRIISQIEVLDGQVTGRKYNSNGEYLGTNVLNTDITISTEGFEIKRDSIIRKDIPFKQFSSFYSADLVVNILPNGKLNQFSGTTPVNWTKAGDWAINEVSTILDSNGIQFDNTYTNSEGIDGKHFESSEIDITGLSSFTFKAEAYADSDIDSVKIAIILYNSSNGSYTYYVDKYGSIKDTSITAIIDKGTEDRYVAFDLSFITNSASKYLNGVDRIKIRIYPGVKLSGGVPTKKKVRFRNLVLTGQSNNYDSEYLGRVYEISNTDLDGSKVSKEEDVFYQDNISASVARFRNTLFVENTSDVTTAWKRTAETETNTLIESVLIDRLSLTSRFSDIFEGEVRGYIDHTLTPKIISEDKRFLILHYEYIVQTDTTELVMVELNAGEISFSKKIYDRYKEGKTIDVSDSKGSISVKGVEHFDAPIMASGGTMYGGLYIDYGIDAIPKTSTDPRATNKGTLLFGANNADNIELGNWNNKTLVQILGGQMKLGQNAMFYEYSVVDGDGTEQYNVGIDAYNTHFEGDIEVVGKVSVGQGALIIEKKLQESGQAAYAEIGAEHYINVTAPEINVLNTLGVNQIVSVSEFPIEVNSEVNFNFPIYITDSDEPNSAISRTALQEVLQEENYWKVGGNVDVTGDMVFDIISAYDGEVQQQPYDYFWKINGINKMQLSDEALDIKTRIKLKGVSATENQVLTSDGFNEVWSLIGVQSIADIADNYQALLDGVGFVKMNGTGVSYEQFGEFGQYLNSSENPNIFDAPWGASYVAGLLTNLPNAIYQGHSIKMSLGEDRPDDATFLSFGLPDENFDSKLYARGIYGGEDTGWKAIGGDISTYIVYRDEAEIELKGYYYEFTDGDRAVFAGIDKTNGTYDILMKSANNLGDTINDYRNYIDTETGRWYFQNATNAPQKYLLEGEVASGGSGTAYTLEEPLYFIGNEINIREASDSQDGFLNSTDWNTFNGKQDLLSEANSTTDGYLSKEDWTTFNDKISDGGSVDVFLNFDNSALYFDRQGMSDIGLGKLKIQNWNAGADPDFVISSSGLDADIVLLPSAAMIVRSATFAANTSVQGIEVDLGADHENSIIKLNGRNYNFKLPSSPTDGQRFVFEYDSTTNKLSLVAE